MDYKEKYEMALERARKNYETAQKLSDSSRLTIDCFMDTLTSIFPELKKSEDERIKRELIEHIKANKCADYVLFKKFSPDDVIAWLEKQESVGEIVERCKTSWYNEGKIAGMAEGLTDDEKYQQGWHDALEKQGEKKVSEYDVVKTIKEKIIEYFDNHLIIDKCFSIGGLKDDILKIINEAKFEKQGEQKETLCDKCKKAQPSHSCQDITALGRCYIEAINTSSNKVEPKFKVGDTMRTLQEATDNITSGLPVVVSIDNEYYRCNNELISIKDQENYEYPPINKKPAWSEEDEEFLSEIISDIKFAQDKHPDSQMNQIIFEEEVTWLKSLKERIK